MICHTARITYNSYEDVIQIKPLADLHVGNAHCDEKRVKEWLRDPNCYFVGNGDLMDMVVASDVKRYRKSSDGTDGDDIIDQQINKIFDWLNPNRDRILGLGTGNHEDAITKHHGTNPMKRLCEMLQVPFLGYSWLMRVVLEKPDGNHSRSFVIRASHGWGGGSRTVGGDLTKFAKDMQHWDADVFLYGHVHKRQTDRIPRMSLVGSSKLMAKDQLIGLTGSFLRTYSKTTDPTYAEIKGYPPIGIGGLILNAKVMKDGIKLWFDN